MASVHVPLHREEAQNAGESRMHKDPILNFPIHDWDRKKAEEEI